MKIIHYLVLLPLLSFGQGGQQQRYIDSLLRELPRQQNDTIKIKLLENLSFVYAEQNPDKGISYGKKALALGEQLKLEKWIASSSAILAINYKSKADFVMAVQLNKKALSIYNKLNDKKNIAGIYANVSLIYLAQSNYAEALKNAFEALNIYEGFQNSKNTAIVLENIGNIYYEQNDYPKSGNYYSRALKIYSSSGSNEDIARCSGNMARLFQAANNYPKALDYFLKALKTNRQLGLSNAIQNNLANIGNVYFKIKDYPKAVRYHSDALKISEQLGIKSSIAVNYGNLGGTYLEMGKMLAEQDNSKAEYYRTLAIDYLEKAVAICQEINFSAPQIEFSQNLAEGYRLSGNYKEAYKILESFTKLQDSIFSQQSKIEVSNLETKRDIELKNKDIIIKSKQFEINKLQLANDRILYLSGIFLLFIAIFIIVRYFVKRIKSQRNAMANIIQVQSHEIRGPVVSILGLSQLLNFNQPDDPANKELIEGIQTLALGLDDAITKVIKQTDQ